MLAERQPVMRTALRILLSTVDGISVVSTLPHATDIPREAASHNPDVIILDIGAHTTITTIRASAPRAAIVVFTVSEDDVHAALRAGARGYLLKSTEPADIVHAIHSVAAGATILGPTVKTSFTDMFSFGQNPFPQLSTRDRELLDLLASGMDNHSLARHFHLSPKTIRNRTSSIFSKLGVSTRAEAIVHARQVGLGHKGGSQPP
ncbi:DNA-binding response regulator, NarL/FixJ family, contains REC and HTH domains [Amycolatopsis xylanica]|uniref:DNA-binding response regulator, NarL/FixJ family, contains REC and HTH domains n=1 Tax=Amycolatopsis xylanica TaxID=589385 RepID=A0A1H2T3W8_9PSEU|nr:response regulator transcription factor [Amycolatopsis xylanica]SDW38520.1 DNA-binding response regulator, NarL/FixJ family, contains REC and HTH domains [Amycolatopsis xylanica]